MSQPNYKLIAHNSKASQDEFEMWQLMELVALIAPKTILEIGVDKGHSMIAWQMAFPDAFVAGIDDRGEVDFPAGYLFDEIRPLNKTLELWGGDTTPGTGVIFK